MTGIFRNSGWIFSIAIFVSLACSAIFGRFGSRKAVHAGLDVHRGSLPGRRLRYLGDRRLWYSQYLGRLSRPTASSVASASRPGLHRAGLDADQMVPGSAQAWRQAWPLWASAAAHSSPRPLSVWLMNHFKTENHVGVAPAISSPLGAIYLRLHDGGRLSRASAAVRTGSRKAAWRRRRLGKPSHDQRRLYVYGALKTPLFCVYLDRALHQRHCRHRCTWPSLGDGPEATGAKSPRSLRRASSV